MFDANNSTKMASKNQRAFLALRLPFMHLFVVLCTYQTLKTYATIAKKQKKEGQLTILSKQAEDWC